LLFFSRQTRQAIIYEAGAGGPNMLPPIETGTGGGLIAVFEGKNRD
jgi:hypothetical protein